MSKLTDRIFCDLYNAYENWTQRVWLRKPHRVQCRICRTVIRSNKEKYSPEQCGWRHVKKYGWICHSCDAHHYEHYIEREALLNCFESDKEGSFIEPNYHDDVLYKLHGDKHIYIDTDKLCKTVGIEIEDGVKVVVKENN